MDLIDGRYNLCRIINFATEKNDYFRYYQQTMPSCRRGVPLAIVMPCHPPTTTPSIPPYRHMHILPSPLTTHVR